MRVWWRTNCLPGYVSNSWALPSALTPVVACMSGWGQQRSTGVNRTNPPERVKKDSGYQQGNAWQRASNFRQAKVHFIYEYYLLCSQLWFESACLAAATRWEKRVQLARESRTDTKCPAEKSFRQNQNKKIKIFQRTIHTLSLWEWLNPLAHRLPRGPLAPLNLWRLSSSKFRANWFILCNWIRTPPIRWRHEYPLSTSNKNNFLTRPGIFSQSRPAGHGWR